MGHETNLSQIFSSLTSFVRLNISLPGWTDKESDKCRDEIFMLPCHPNMVLMVNESLNFPS